MIVSEEKRRRVLREVDQAVSCRHMLAAPSCSVCRGRSWLESITASGKTVGQVIEGFVESGKIKRIEIEQHLLGGKGGKIKKRRR